MQYKPPLPPTNQVTMDLAFQSAVNVASLPRTQPRGLTAATAASFQYPPVAPAWPLHPAAIPPFYHPVQLHRLAASSTRMPQLPVPSRRQMCQPLPGGLTCHRCRGVGYIARECPTGRHGRPPRCYQCNGIGHIHVRETVGVAPASTYETALQIAALAGNKEPLLEVQIGSRTFQALLDRSSSVSLLRAPAARVAVEAGTIPKTQERALCLASREKLSNEDIKRILDYYTKDELDCSRQSPNKKDVVGVRFVLDEDSATDHDPVAELPPDTNVIDDLRASGVDIHAVTFDY
ncbi:hypothetical protein HPB50_005340 [Hyalomma asiaticum]|uniref:Uncharacterized protein n=1 Tax=Hyalomma asiaticum TaxID=266040 RepID=A0ACB7SL50_HYAAI|nr:hypothetical protein HPB50_005340 [Hyalomma asiaticum]